MADLSRRSLLASAVAAPFLNARPPAARPNILFICTDQHRGSALSSMGDPIVKTPNMDRLAARGVLFRNAYCGNPVCAPGRASMMTGRFASDVGSYCNSTPFDGNGPTWGTRLRDAGYYTWATGKMDLWKGRDLGFHEVNTNHGHCEDPDITSLFRSPVCFRPGERGAVNGSWNDRPAPDRPKAQNALRLLSEQSKALGKPWAAYVGFVKPHPKWDAATKFREMYPPERMPLPQWPAGYLERRHTMFQVLANFKNISVPVSEDRVRRARAAYYGMITEVDELIGELLDGLERTGQADNTLVVYTSDHGEMLGEHGLWLKNVLLEGAAHVPMILAGPGVPKGRSVDTAVGHVDLIATMLEAAGAPITSDLRGHSLLGTHPGFAFCESHSEGNCTGSFMIRQGDWKYLYFSGDDPLLFNLKDDPGEFHNLAMKQEHAGVLKELHGKLRSLVDPDAVTDASFRKQEAVLGALVRKQTKQQFQRMLVGRLGSAQARALAGRHYRM